MVVEIRRYALVLAFLPMLTVLRGQTVTLDSVFDARVDSGGSIYVSALYTPSGGSQTSGNLRYTSGGALDHTFNDTSNHPAFSFALPNDGSVFVNSSAGLLKLSNTGTADGSFQNDEDLLPFSTFGRRTLLLDGSGNAFYTGAAKYSWSGSAWTQTPYTGFTTFDTQAIAIQSDGKILLGGTGGNLVRLNADGSLDATFSIGNGNIQGLAVQSGGRIIVSGDGFTSGAANGLNVFRLNPNGSLDGTFSTVGYTTLGFSAYGPVTVLYDDTVLISNSNNGADISFDGSGRAVTAGTQLGRLAQNGALFGTQPSLMSGFPNGVGVFAIPEPSTFAFFGGVAVLGLAGYFRRRD